MITIAVFILAAVAPIFSQLLAMAISRQREYLADASSVEFTRNPRALLRALERIAQDRIAAQACVTRRGASVYRESAAWRARG